MTRPQLLLVDSDDDRVETIQRLLRRLIPNIMFVHAGSARSAVDAAGMLVPPDEEYPSLAAIIHASIPAGTGHPEIQSVASPAEFAPAAATSLMLQARGALPQELIFGVATEPGDVMRLAGTGAFARVVSDSLFSGGEEMIRATLPELFRTVTPPPAG